MKISWKKSKKFKPQIVLDKINSIKTVTEDNRVSYEAFRYNESMTALLSMIDFKIKDDVVNCKSLVSKAVKHVALVSDLSEKSVIDEINRLYKEEVAVKENEYKILTSISAAQDFPIRKVSIEGCSLRLIKGEYPKKYLARNDIISKQRNIEDITPINYTKIIVSLKSKSVNGAATKGLRIIDIFRSVSCLFLNSGMEIIGDEWSPINKIRLGNIHTVHHASGKPSTDLFWYEPNFTKSNPHTPRKPEVFVRNYKWFFENLEKSPYRRVIKDSLLRYVRALDERDHNVAQIKIWGALESLAAPSEANYDLITRRCSFLFAEPEYHRQMLEHLRESRNQTVHAGDSAEQAKTNCFQLQYYLYHLLLFHIRNATEFSSLEEANSYLDLPTNVQLLENKVKILNKAIKYRNPDT